jgi:thiol-disulfide isomerase/thioredoxin
MIELPEDIILSMRHCLSQVRLPDHRVINLRFQTTKAGEEFVNRNGDRLSRAEQFAKLLGFESCIVTHSPGGGAPETLLRKPAPDFSLESLDGRTIHLQDHIRGKAALVTFWGVACGPCRVEAPHLSALYEKYQGTGFTLLAVNAYDETMETVAEYVKKQSLVHPIGLQGREVARQKYSVGAYPTTFWIDREGFVIDYTIGFDPGDEAHLAATVQRLLKPTSPESP